MYWRKIESAPMCKDSSIPQARVLVTRKCENGVPLVLPAFLTTKGWRWKSKKTIPFEPTHWRPIPKPPGYYLRKIKRFFNK